MKLRAWILSSGSLALGAVVAAFVIRGVHFTPESELANDAASLGLRDGVAVHADQTLLAENQHFVERDDASGPQGSEASEPWQTETDNDAREFHEFVEAVHTEGRAKLLQRETEQLVAAGFTSERIQWLRQRTEELRAERKLTGGPSDPYMHAAYIADKDLDLLSEIGEEEYDRYRKALGRPTGVAIEQVSADASAPDYGLVPGDEIVRYAGKRIYNGSMLSHEVAVAEPSGSVTLVVLRDGQQLSIVVPSGPLQLRTESPGMARMRRLGPPPSAYR